MAEQKLISKNHQKINGKMVITETVEKTFTKDDLIAEKQNYQRQKSQIIVQMNQLKERYEQINEFEKNVDRYIAEFTEEELPQIPSE